jgi:hypothetical protein
MLISRILEVESGLFVYGLATIVIWKILRARINMRGLLMDKSRPSQISPARIQLLISTIAVCVGYLQDSSALQQGNFPQVDSGWLFFFGGSSLIYSARKVFERFHGPK